MAVATGDLDVAEAAALFAEPSRARILTALADGRSLPASVLAAEAGVTPQAASTQLARLLAADLIAAERSGRHRYYRLASAHVATVLEALAQLSPPRPVRSLRESTRAAALRAARTCYDHLAGRLGVQVTAALIERDVLTPTDGVPDGRRRPGDPLATGLPEAPYALGPAAATVLPRLGVPAERLVGGGRRPLLRVCVDWSEQRHHLSGRLGADLLTGFVDAGWIVRVPRQRAVRLTEEGSRALRSHLDVSL